MEGVGARLGRSSTRYGPATVFTGPVRRWKKKWVHVTPPNAVVSSNNNNNDNNNNHHHHHQTSINNNNGNSSSNGSNDNASHLMLYKWTPISQSQSAAVDSNSNGDAVGEEDEEPPRRKIKYIPIALLEEQRKESPEELLHESAETDPNPKVDSADGKPDINDVPMVENQDSEETNAGRQDLNESKLDLNARDGDGDEDGEETEVQER